MLFDFTHHWFAIAEIIVAIFLLTEGALVLLQNPRSPLNRSFFFFQLPVFIWMAGMGFAYLSTDAATSFALAKIGFVGVILIPITTFTFSVYFAGKTGERPLVIIGLVVSAFFIGFVNNPALVPGVTKFPWGFYISLTPWGILVLGLFAVYMSLFARNFFEQYRRSTRRRRWHFLAFITGMLS